MSLLSSLKSLFTPLPEGTIRYKGFTIEATPEEDGSRFRACAVIRKSDQERSYTLIDRVATKNDSVQLVFQKAKRLIDQKGEAVFIPK